MQHHQDVYVQHCWRLKRLKTKGLMHMSCALKPCSSAPAGQRIFQHWLEPASAANHSLSSASNAAVIKAREVLGGDAHDGSFQEVNSATTGQGFPYTAFSIATWHLRPLTPSACSLEDAPSML